VFVQLANLSDYFPLDWNVRTSGFVQVRLPQTAGGELEFSSGPAFFEGRGYVAHASRYFETRFEFSFSAFVAAKVEQFRAGKAETVPAGHYCSTSAIGR